MDTCQEVEVDSAVVFFETVENKFTADRERGAVGGEVVVEPGTDMDAGSSEPIS